MARLGGKTKKVIRGLKAPGEQNRMRAPGIKALKQELRSAGVSAREKKLVKHASRIVRARTTASEALGVRRQFAKQARRSSLQAAYPSTAKSKGKGKKK